MNPPADAKELEIRKAMLDEFTVWLLKKHKLLIDDELLALVQDPAPAPTTPSIEAAKAALADLSAKIQAYNVGDKPQSPPAHLLMEEARLKNIIGGG